MLSCCHAHRRADVIKCTMIARLMFFRCKGLTIASELYFTFDLDTSRRIDGSLETSKHQNSTLSRSCKMLK